MTMMTAAKKKNYSLHDARTAFRPNLTGDPARSKYGDDRRLIWLKISEDEAEDFKMAGVTVKYTKPGLKNPHPEEFVPEPFVQCQAKFRDQRGDELKYPPKIYLVPPETVDKDGVVHKAEPRLLGEEELGYKDQNGKYHIGIIDRVPIKRVRAVLNEYRRNEDASPSLYINVMYVEQADSVYDPDPFAKDYACEPDEDPF